jgi:hypothetical protein
MGAFKEFVNKKLNEETKQVSSNLIKNIIDVIKEYVVTEYDLSEDNKMDIINNMEIGVEEHDKGILKKGPRFIASSNYDGGEGKQIPVEIIIELVTQKIGKKQEVDSAEEFEVPEEISDENENEKDSEE